MVFRAVEYTEKINYAMNETKYEICKAQYRFIECRRVEVLFEKKGKKLIAFNTGKRRSKSTIYLKIILECSSGRRKKDMFGRLAIDHSAA